MLSTESEDVVTAKAHSVFSVAFILKQYTIAMFLIHLFILNKENFKFKFSLVRKV